MASKRKYSRQAIPCAIDMLGDLYDYALPPLTRTSRATMDKGDSITVFDDWPEFIPITDAELRVIEAYFTAEIEELFGTPPL
jgi:hypothetical protein